MRAEVLSFLAFIRSGFGKNNLQEEEISLEEIEILIGTSGEDQHQGNQVKRKGESPSRQQRPIRHAAGHNANAEQFDITETEEDAVQRVKKNNEVKRKGESPLRQQRPVRHAARHNANAEKVSITETEQDAVQRVNKNNEVQRKRESPSWQQRTVRHAAALNTNAAKVSITKTEQDSVQRVKENNEDSNNISVRVIPIKRCNNA
jgi:hypothetical protein